MSTVMLDYALLFLNDELFMPIDCSDGYFFSPSSFSSTLQRLISTGWGATQKQLYNVICDSSFKKNNPDDVMVMSSGLPQLWFRRKVSAEKFAVQIGVVKTGIFTRQGWSLQRDKYQVALWELGNILFGWSPCRELTRCL